MNLTIEDKKQIKAWCLYFNARKLWIDDIEVNVP